MTPQETLVHDFENGLIDNTTFNHGDHVRVIWSLIHTWGALEAVARFDSGLKRLTAAAGQPAKYHATITYAFAFLVAERVARQGRLSWDAFTDANRDLLVWPNATIAAMYPQDTLDSAEARSFFVLPPV